MPNFNPAGTAQRYLFTISCVLLLFSLLVACGGGNRMKPTDTVVNSTPELVSMDAPAVTGAQK
jgi:hypothetical protein